MTDGGTTKIGRESLTLQDKRCSVGYFQVVHVRPGLRFNAPKLRRVAFGPFWCDRIARAKSCSPSSGPRVTHRCAHPGTRARCTRAAIFNQDVLFSFFLLRLVVGCCWFQTSHTAGSGSGSKNACSQVIHRHRLILVNPTFPEAAGISCYTLPPAS